MNWLLAVLAPLFVCLAGLEPVAAQVGGEAPDAAARSFFAALEGRRWADAARMVHPDALARYHQRQLMILRSDLEGRAAPPMTADQILRMDPRMPRAVAEYQAEQSNRNHRDIGRIQLEMAGVASVEELERLTPEEAFARFLAAHDEQRSLRRHVEAQGDTMVAELLARSMPRTTRTAVGSVAAGAEVAYVVYSASERMPGMPQMGREHVSTVAMRRDGGAWKVDPGEPMAHELFGGNGFAVMLDEDATIPNLPEEVARAVVWPEQGPPRLRARMEGAGADPLRQPPRTLVLERLAPDGTVAARVEVPAEAWETLAGVVGLWTVLIPATEAP